MQTTDVTFASPVAEKPDLYKGVSHSINLDLPGTGGTYRVEVVSGSFETLAERLAANPWWADGVLAKDIAQSWGRQLWREFGASINSLDSELCLFATAEANGRVHFQGTFAGRTIGSASIRKEDIDAYVIATPVCYQGAVSRSGNPAGLWNWVARLRAS